MKRAILLSFFMLIFIISFVSAEICLDADKGDLGERGRTAILDDQGYEKSFNLDYCTDSNNQTAQAVFSEINKYQSCSGSNCYIVEFVCASDTKSDYSITSCFNGCSSGACPTGGSFDYLGQRLVINEGETKYFTINRNVYAFQLDPFMGDKVGLIINRKDTPLLSINDAYEFDDLILMVLDISVAPYYGDTGEGNIISPENGRVGFVINKIGCEPVGLRNETNYCSLDKRWVKQKISDESCQNNFECTSNLCVSSKCVDPTLWEKIIIWFKNLFGED